MSVGENPRVSFFVSRFREERRMFANQLLGFRTITVSFTVFAHIYLVFCWECESIGKDFFCLQKNDSFSFWDTCGSITHVFLIRIRRIIFACTLLNSSKLVTENQIQSIDAFMYENRNHVTFFGHHALWSADYLSSIGREFFRTTENRVPKVFDSTDKTKAWWYGLGDAAYSILQKYPEWIVW